MQTIKPKKINYEALEMKRTLKIVDRFLDLEEIKLEKGEGIWASIYFPRASEFLSALKKAIKNALEKIFWLSTEEELKDINDLMTEYLSFDNKEQWSDEVLQNFKNYAEEIQEGIKTELEKNKVYLPDYEFEIETELDTIFWIPIY